MIHQHFSLLLFCSCFSWDYTLQNRHLILLFFQPPKIFIIVSLINNNNKLDTRYLIPGTKSGKPCVEISPSYVEIFFSSFRLRWKEFLKCPFALSSAREGCQTAAWVLLYERFLNTTPKLDIDYCFSCLQPRFCCSRGEEAFSLSLILSLFPSVIVEMMS